MSKFYYKLVNDLKRSIFIVSSHQIKIPVFFTLNVDFTLLETNKVKSIEIRRYAKEWERKVIDYLRSNLSNDEFELFEFNFIYIDAYRNGHSISYKIDYELAKKRILDYNEKKKEERRIKYVQSSVSEMQQAYLNQDINNNDYEEGSRLPSFDE